MPAARYQPKCCAPVLLSGLGAQLAVSANPGLSTASVLNRPILPASGVTRVPAQNGYAFQHSASNGNVNFGVNGGLSELIPAAESFSVFMRIYVSTLGVRQGILGDHASGSGNNESISFEITAANQWRFGTTSTGPAFYPVPLVGGITMGWYNILLVHRAGVNNELFVNGVSVGSVAVAGVRRAGASLRLGGFGALSTVCFQGRTAAFHIFRGDVSSQVKALGDNPWQVFSDLEEDDDRVVSAGSDGTATVTGTFTASGSGTTTASGEGRSSVPSAVAQTQPGAVIAATSAFGSVTGAQMQSQAGTVTASAAGNASATVVGAQASAMAGAAAASGSGLGTLVGASAQSAAGAVIASAGGNASAVVAGAGVSAVAGSIAGRASAFAGVGSAPIEAGTTPPVAGGDAATDLVGAASTFITGAIAAAASARASITGAIASASAGVVSATATGDGSGTAVVAGASAIAAAGQVAANGTRAGITVDVTEDMICEVVRGYIKSIAGELRVIRTPVNKASMPDGPFVTFTPGVRRPLSTNVSQYDGMNARSVNRPEQMTFQIDCYGEGSSDLAETLNTLFRDQYAVGLFAQSPFGIAPLYANDIMQAPFVNDADQYEERYLFEIVLQVNSVIALPQQYCKMLSIDLISVDAFFPPEEVA